MRATKRKPEEPNPLGSIRADEIMPAREFCRRFGLGRDAWDALRRRGFPTLKDGKQRLVDGAKALDFFRGSGATAMTAAGQPQ